MDDFTWNSYCLEADMIQIKPDNVTAQLESISPDLLFVESAWNGVDGLWNRKISTCSAELLKALNWCKSRNIPTVFWNKEDPIHFTTFRQTALNFDYIFTYDFNCVEKYKSLTGRHNVFYLPMGVQPRMFNPVEKYSRLDKFCFAGSYYVRYRDRTEDLDSYVEFLPEYRDMDIYDRQFGKNDPNYMFPDNYRKFIRGNLPYTEIDRAYKGYEYSINLNSIKQAQSCARRVFELFACNTFIISNYSIGVKTLFGDLMLVSDSGKEVVRRLKELGSNPLRIEKLKLLGLRKVFTESTYQDRLAYILNKTGIMESDCDWRPLVTVWGRADNAEDVRIIKEMFSSQRYAKKRLVIVTSLKSGLEDGVLYVSDASEMFSTDDSGYYACFSVKNFYGKDYLTDLVLAVRYGDTGNYTKSSVFENRGSQIIRTADSGRPYTYADELIPDESLMAETSFRNSLSSVTADSSVPVKQKCLRTDSFNFCRNLNLQDATREQISVFSDGAEDTCCGVAVSELQRIAENQIIRFPEAEMKNNGADGDIKKLTPEFMYGELSSYAECKQSLLDKFLGMIKGKSKQQKKIFVKLDNGELFLDYELPASSHEYLMLNKTFPVTEISDGKVLNLYLKNRGSVVGIAYYLYANGKKIFSKLCQPNNNIEVDLPENVTHVKLGLRVASSGSSVIDALYLDKYRDLFKIPGHIFNSHKTVIVVHHYPSYKDIYRYGFVHSRVRGYIKKGVNPLVFVLSGSELTFSEYEGVDIISGNNEVLDKILKEGVDTVLVHFMSADIWKSLKELPSSINIYVWCHGADVLLFDRRSYNYVTAEEIRYGHQVSNSIKNFWSPIFSNIPENLHFVFVSEFLAGVVMEDYGVTIPKNKYSVIHNPIDTSIFKYREKNPEDRFKLLSIRPFATRMYANDLTLKAINILAQRKDFERFDIMIVGDGKLFDKTITILKNYPNVKIRRGFLSHYEIAELHSKYGVFICPTRYDTQGVSRDEARASGLVPVTTEIAAVPEFVNKDTAMLTEPENPESIAEAVSQLADNPDLFVRMSRVTSESAVSELSMEKVITQELELIGKK